MSVPSERGEPVAGIVLAAGMSTRMGENKLLVRVAGESLLRRVAGRVIAAGLEPVIVVLGHDADRAREELAGLRCEALMNHDYARGVATSSRVGVEAVGHRAGAAIVVLGDMPLVTTEMIRTLIERYRTTGVPLVVSDYGGVKAPPMLYDRSLFAELLAMDGGGCGQRVLKRHRASAAVVSWPAEALIDVDVPADRARVEAILERGSEATHAPRTCSSSRLISPAGASRSPLPSSSGGARPARRRSATWRSSPRPASSTAGSAAAASSRPWRHRRVRRSARGQPRLLSLSPDAADERRAGVVSMPMTCHSGGSVEIYVEPVLPAPRLVIFGVSPVAQALAKLGSMMGFIVDAVDPAADPAIFPDAARITSLFNADDFSRPDRSGSRLYAVVATFGDRDEDAIADALEADPAYLGVVASRKRFAEIKATLLARGIGRTAWNA